jgi:hypothetical protein
MRYQLFETRVKNGFYNIPDKNDNTENEEVKSLKDEVKSLKGDINELKQLLIDKLK